MNTMLEWQRCSQSSTDVPHYKDLLEFINLRAQASETSLSDSGRKFIQNWLCFFVEKDHASKSVASFTSSTDTSSNCVV